MYEAMARRYRPRTFDDVIGQEHVAQTLKNAIATERVAHAYLFCGPHGCGKTSMARIFACALVCEKGPTATPCGECAICRDVLRGQDLDVQEIDGASNNGVEQVRALREQAGYIPTRARFKVYIIDEVHMLSVAAFNALLKTLEEPPAHVKFILATTDPHKILGTILSRCQRFDFRLVPPPRLAEFFKKLVAQENAEISEDALDAVAAFSGGSVRDGLVLLDQLLSYAQGKVTREDVERVRGVAGAEAVAGIYEAVLSHDVKRALHIVDEVAQRGTNVGDFLDQLIEYGRDLMLVAATGTQDGITAYGPARKVLFEIAAAVSLDQTLLMLDVFAQARTRVRSRALTNPLVPLEMAVARLAGLEALEPVSRLIARLDACAQGAPLPTHNPVCAQAAVPISSPAPAPVAPSAPAPAAVQPAPATPTAPLAAAPATPAAPAQTESRTVTQKDLPPWETAPESRNSIAEGVTSAAPATGAEEDSSSTSDDMGGCFVEEDVEEDATESIEAPVTAAPRPAPLMATPSVPAAGYLRPATAKHPVDASPDEMWASIQQTLAAANPADHSLLADVRLERYASDTLYLRVPAGSSFLFEQLNDRFRLGRIAECAQTVLGRPTKVQFMQEREQPAPASRLNPAQERQNVSRDPGVRLLLDAFDGAIINVEEGR